MLQNRGGGRNIFSYVEGAEMFLDSFRFNVGA